MKGVPDGGADVPVRHQDEGDENGEGELGEVAIPSDVVRVQPQLGRVQGVHGAVGLKQVQVEAAGIGILTYSCHIYGQVVLQMG